ITRYLSQLSEKSLTEEQTATMNKYVNIINDLEGLADLIHKIIVPFARAKARESIRFSEEGFRELLNWFDTVCDNFMLTINAFATNNRQQAERVIRSEHDFDLMEKKFRTSHISRIFQQKIQSIETSTMHLDLLGCFKRINTHSVDIARAMIGEWYSLRPAVSDQPAEAKPAIEAKPEIQAPTQTVPENPSIAEPVAQESDKKKEIDSDKIPENWY
ncbi:MAG: PhoU domain-containing protein, partial [Candidatus Rifleibacteriota bacterium]